MHILLHRHDTQLLRGLFKMFINLPKLQFNCDFCLNFISPLMKFSITDSAVAQGN